MALMKFIKIEGEKQSEMTKGASTAASLGFAISIGEQQKKDYEDYIAAPMFVLDGVKSFNASGAQATERQYRAKFIKYVDKATPLMLQSFGDGEVLKKVTVHCFRTGTSNQPEKSFEVVMENGKFESFALTDPDSIRDSAAQSTETWTVVFDKIQTTYTTKDNASTTSSDKMRG